MENDMELNTIEEERMMRLQRARLRDRIFAENITGELAQRVAVKLNKLISDGHNTAVFFIVITLAIAKDGLLDIGLDFLGIGLIPILGQIPGYFLSAVLFYIMQGKGMLRGRIFGLVLVFFLADSFPLIEELPLTVFAVMFAWHGIVKKARQAESDLHILKQKTQEELEAIEREE